MSKSWYKLNIDISNAILPSYDIENFLIDADYVIRNKNAIWELTNDQLSQMFSTDWLGYMESIGLPVNNALIFYREAFFTHPNPHVDLMYGQEQYPALAINWVLGEDDSEMVWYTIKKNTILDQKIIPTGQGHTYNTYDINDLIELDRHRIGNIPTIVRVDIPHNIVVGKNSRWAISIRVSTRDHNIVEWDKFINFMKPYIL